MHLHATALTGQLTTAAPTDAEMRLARDAGARLRAALQGDSPATGRPLRFKVLHPLPSDGARGKAESRGKAASRSKAASRGKAASPGKAASRGSAASEGETVEIPGAAAALLLHLLGHLAEGEAVTIVPVQREYTTQQAADFLGVSRPFVVKEIEEKRLPARKVGTRRRVMYGDLMKYKARADAGRQKALDGLTALDQALGLM